MAVTPVGNAYAPPPPPPPEPDDTPAFNDAVNNAKAAEPVELYGGGSNTVELTNTSDKAMTVHFRSNLDEGATAEQRAQSEQFVDVPAGQTVTVELPDNWGGNARKYVEGNDSANLAEFTFKDGQLWFDESDETGRNASIEMESNGLVAGSSESILGDAPEGSFTYDAEGNKVLSPSKTNSGAFDHLTNKLGSDNVYIHSEDHTALRSAQTNKLSISFGDA